MKVIINKRLNGQYFTKANPFNNEAFEDWALDCSLKKQNILEPFAGSNNLIEMLKELNFCKQFTSFDIEPKNKYVFYRDTLQSFPLEFKVCITNPPYLAQNSAKRRGLPYPITEYDDLYKFALSKCLDHCEYVGAIVPASFLNSKLFRSRLTHYVLLTNKMFEETDHPVCLALFKKTSKDVSVYEGNDYIGMLSKFEKKLPKINKNIEMRFNDKDGNLGLIAIDNTIEPSIKFCRGREIDPSKITSSARSITRISLDVNTDKLINRLNDRLISFREETYDLFLTPFKGLRKDNRYRRRLDYALARDIINEVCF